MKKSVYLTMLLLAGTSLFSRADNDVYDDDIYYNPKKDVGNVQKESAYIENFGDIDVDTYNRRGQYYTTPVDTIGEAVGSAEDFVYTQQIQKFINPTIVVDNSDVLYDVLNNSYGNVTIVINDNGLPVFSPYVYSWPSYRSYYSYWGPTWGFGWNVWDPYYSWYWGPSWGYYDPFWYGYGWGWGHTWGWDPYRPYWHHSHDYYANHYRPGGNRHPNSPQDGWASNTRPGGNRGYTDNGSSRGYNFNGNGHRVSNGTAASTPTSGSNRSSTMHRQSNGNYSASDSRVSGTTVRNDGSSGNNRSSATKQNYNSNRSATNSTVQGRTTTNSTYNRNSGTTTNRGSYNSGTTNRNSGNSYNNHRSTTNTNSNRSSYNSSNSRSSYNSGRSSSSMGRSSGGFGGGGRSSGGSRGGGGGGRHR